MVLAPGIIWLQPYKKPQWELTSWNKLTLKILENYTSKLLLLSHDAKFKMVCFTTIDNKKIVYCHTGDSHQFSPVAQSCPTLCDLMNRSTPGLPVHHQLPEFTWTHVHRVGDAIRPSHPLPSPSPPAPNPSQHQGLFQWVNSLYQVAKVLKFQLQHQFFQWTPRTELL